MAIRNRCLNIDMARIALSRWLFFSPGILLLTVFSISYIFQWFPQSQFSDKPLPQKCFSSIGMWDLSRVRCVSECKDMSHFYLAHGEKNRLGSCDWHCLLNNVWIKTHANMRNIRFYCLKHSVWHHVFFAMKWDISKTKSQLSKRALQCVRRQVCFNNIL